MTTSRSLFRILAPMVLVAGLAALVFHTWHVPLANLVHEARADLLLWLAVTAVAAMTPIPLPRGRGTVPVTSALDFAALLVFGPAVSVWVAGFSGVLANMLRGGRPLPGALYRLGQMMLAAGLAGWVYVRMGGVSGVALVPGTDAPGPLLAAAGVHLGVRLILGGVEVFLTVGRRRVRALVETGAARAPFAVVLLPVAVLLAMTQLRAGAIGIVLFLVPLLLARYLFQLWTTGRQAHVETVRTLMAAVDAADPFTRGHSYRISKMCVALARHLGVGEREIDEIEYAAVLHDIGRTAIQHDVLVKSGKLTDREQSLFRAHPKVGHDVLRRFRHFEDAADVVHAHHEQPDGTGYPRGLAGEEIPMGSRIIMAVAAFDAMTSDRPYRRGLSPEAAFEELLANSGTQFFPDVVEGLIGLYSSGRLFAEFDQEELERYAREQCSSRALEEFLKAKGLKVPGKLASEGTDGNEESGVPVLELPASPEEPRDMKKEFLLTRDGKWRLEASALSDVGCVRSNNEDSFGMKGGADTASGCLLCLADGMGGAAAGEVASDLAVKTLERVFFEKSAALGVRDALVEAIEEANRAIHQRSSTESGLAGMGTTCTTLAFAEREVYVGHVGDSRAYLVEKGRIVPLTQDHTLAAELEQMVGPGAVAPEGASNVLTRCLGTKAQVDVEFSLEPLKLEAGQVFILCSDGLSNMVAPEEIHHAVERHGPEEACRILVALARERGGPDNITIQIARVFKS